MQMQMAKKQQGFTIIELVVVILLLGILAATALPRFLDVTEEAHQAAFDGTFGGFSTGVALYRAQWVGGGQPAADQPIAEFNNLRVARSYTAGVSDDDGVSFDGGDLTDTASGYPVGASAVTVFASSGAGSLLAARCIEVFQGVLQSGAASLNANTTFDYDSDELQDFQDDIASLQTTNPADYQVYSVEMPVDTNIAIDTDGVTAGVQAPAGAGAALEYEDTLPACIYVYAAEAGNVNRSIVYVPWTGELTRYDDVDDLFTRLTDSGVNRNP